MNHLKTPFKNQYKFNGTFLALKIQVTKSKDLMKASVVLILPSYLSLFFILILVESSMFTFVYLWTPTLSTGGTAAPLGNSSTAQYSTVQYGYSTVQCSAEQCSIE